MKLLIDLFSTDYGLLSLGVIAFVIVMAIFLFRYFLQHIESEEGS